MSEESMFERAMHVKADREVTEPDTVKQILQPELDKVSYTPQQPPNTTPKIEKNLLMSDAIVNPEYVPNTMLGAWKAIMFETADGQKYIAHRAQEGGYMLTRLSVDNELDGAPITITKEQARHILVLEKKQFICEDLTLDVARIIQMGK